MPKRTICIQSPVTLTTKSSSLLVTSSKGTLRIPYEDIWVVILENHSIQVSCQSLSDLAEAGIGVMVCGKNHMPNSLFLPIGAHSRHAAIVEDQLAMSKPLKKQLWKRIVESKIRNQALVLEQMGFSSFSSSLMAMSRDVTSGDRTGREATAASSYFHSLIPEGTRRNSAQGNCLDYGYAVLRAGIARTAVAGGWLVSRGIHHSSSMNAFNLVDDLIEPFRPVVDLLVFAGLTDQHLSPQTKGELAALFEYQVLADGKLHSVQTAIEMELDSLKRAVLNQDASLLILPQIVELARCEVEEG